MCSDYHTTFSVRDVSTVLRCDQRHSGTLSQDDWIVDQADVDHGIHRICPGKLCTHIRKDSSLQQIVLTLNVTVAAAVSQPYSKCEVPQGDLIITRTSFRLPGYCTFCKVAVNIPVKVCGNRGRIPLHALVDPVDRWISWLHWCNLNLTCILGEDDMLRRCDVQLTNVICI
jgi:hypothetical protein